MTPPLFTRVALTGLLLALLVIVGDQASKAWILYGLNLSDQQQISVFPFFSLTMERNYSMSFGLLGTGADYWRGIGQWH
jgi:signal peptidase II